MPCLTWRNEARLALLPKAELSGHRWPAPVASCGMGLSPRPDYTPRRVREQRAYRLVMVGGGASLVAVAGFVLALLNIVGFGIPLIAAIVAVVCLLWFRRTVSGS